MLVCKSDVRRGAAERLCVQIQTGKQGVSETLGSAAVVESAACVVLYLREVGGVLLETIHELGPYGLGLHQRIACLVYELLEVRNASEAVEQHIIVVAAHHLKLSGILGVYLIGHRGLIVVKGLEQLVTKNCACDGGLPDVAEGTSHLVPVVCVEVAPVTAVCPVLVGHTCRTQAFVGSKGNDSPVSPVVVEPFDFGVALADQQSNVRFVGHKVRGGGVSIVDLFQHLVTGAEEAACHRGGYDSNEYLFHCFLRFKLEQTQVETNKEGGYRRVE